MKKVLSPADINNITSLCKANNVIKYGGADNFLSDFIVNNRLRYFLNFKKISTVSFLSQPLEFGINRRIKRLIDIFFSMIFIAGILTWLTPILAILIKADSRGPVFFLQKRNKKNGRIFMCIKFRSMIVNEEADRIQAKENDIRITRMGKFLRKYHIDELPQFINVLLSDMSVIGPRPHMISDNLKYENILNHYFFRAKVKPGITGLAQVSGYSGPVTDIDKMKTRVQIDNFYITHWSLKLDIAILFTTIIKATN